MKLQKLTIHNIASIEDAVIDFSAEPLSSSEVFLITGKTGSGKSTILDAICLALYATTPRFESSNMQGEAPDGDITVRLTDPRQLLRRNTGEGHVTLTFIGNNNRRYEAQWGIARAHGKPDRRLQKKSWTLTDLDRKIAYTKDAEIRAEIADAVGLDFQQFCRTTILAQGEFTRFLNSHDEDKAAILEKITGVGIYARLGQRIYELTREHEDAYNAAREKVNDIVLLDEEQKKELEARYSAAEQEEKVLIEQRKAVENKRTWLDVNASLTTQRNEAADALTTARETVESDDFKRQETDVDHWQSTITPREQLRRRVKADNDLADARDTETALAAKYDTARAAIAFLEDRLAADRDSLDALNRQLADEASRTPLYEQQQTLSGSLKAIVTARAAIAAIDTARKTLDAQLEERQTAKDKADEDLKNADTVYEEHAKTLKEKEKALEETCLPTLREKNDKESLSLNDIAAAGRALEAQRKEQERRKEEQEAIEKAVEALNLQRHDAAELQPQVEAARKRYDDLKAAYEMQNNSADKWAKAMRVHLHEGDTCPLCRQTIAGVLPTEDEIAAIVNKAKTLRDKAETEYNTLKDRLNTLEAEIKAAQTALDERRRKYDDDSEMLNLTAEAEKKCAVLEITDLTKASDTLTRMKEESEQRQSEIKSLIAQGEALEAEIKAMRTKAEELRCALDEARQTADAAKTVLGDTQTKIENKATLRKARQTDEDAATRDVAALLADTAGWRHDWRTQPALFDDELAAATAEWNTARKKASKLEASIALSAAELKTLTDAVAAITTKMPRWAERPVGASREQEKLGDFVRTLAGDVERLTERRLTAEENRRKATDALNRYLEENTLFTLERLASLEAIAEDDIAETRKALQEKRDALTTAQGRLKQCDDNLRQHHENRPAIADGETVESLDGSLAEINAAVDEKKNVMIEIKNSLVDDKKKRERVGEMMKEVETKLEVFTQWNRLNQLLGDATGSKFRRIAQSYILENLIHAANAYMRQLTDRYTLHVVPGRFVITIEDAYQGYVTRTAGTLSGGESFLVSLALALALSDIGQRLAVDSLFIDEGFGTLSGEPLNNAIATLRDLHNKAGRHVGLISHVTDLRDHIPVQIQVHSDARSSAATIRTVVT